MWFKNAMPYRLLERWAYTLEQVDEALAERPFEPCGPTDVTRWGWVPPMGGDSNLLAYHGNGCIMFALRIDTKDVPSFHLEELVGLKVRALEARGETVHKRWRQELKEEVLFELLPHALPETRFIYAVLDYLDGWLYVDAASWGQAEQFTERLRETLGSLPVAPPSVINAPQSVMTAWVARQELPEEVTLGEEAVLEDPQSEGCIVRLVKQDLTADEVSAHIKSGKRLRQLAVTIDQRLTLLLSADLSLKRMKFSDIVIGGRGFAETPAEIFDADFTLMTLELRRLLPEILGWFGGEAPRLAIEGPTQVRAAAAHDDELLSADERIRHAELVVRTAGRASVSRLQRVLKVSYNRANNLMELLERNGVVGPTQPDGTRQVLPPAGQTGVLL